MTAVLYTLAAIGAFTVAVAAARYAMRPRSKPTPWMYPVYRQSALKRAGGKS